jgi:hypothetical protein
MPHVTPAPVAQLPLGNDAFLSDCLELTILSHHVTQFPAMTSCVAWSTTRPCLLSSCSPVSKGNYGWCQPAGVVCFPVSHVYTTYISHVLALHWNPLPPFGAMFYNFGPYMTLDLFLYWRGFYCLFACFYLSHTLLYIPWHSALSHAFMPSWLSSPPCIQAAVWTKLWNAEFYW